MTAPDHADTLNPTSTNETSSPDTSPSEAGATEAKSASAGSLEEQLAVAKKEASDNYDRYLRSVADLENFRRRSIREKDELRQFAISRVLEDLLPVLDNLSLGLTAAKAPNADLKTLVGGIGMVQEQLKSTLANHGLKEINPAGQKFDPNQHESIASQPGTVSEGSVAQVVRIGYSLNGRLVRPASVIVSSGPAKEATTS
jgi:molecular chaperone GrpE